MFSCHAKRMKPSPGVPRLVMAGIFLMALTLPNCSIHNVPSTEFTHITIMAYLFNSVPIIVVGDPLFTIRRVTENIGYSCIHLG